MKIFIGVGLCIFIFFSNDYISNCLMSYWEIAPIPIKNIKKRYDVAIVLTGITVHKKPFDRVYFAKGADRATQTLQLYKLGLVKKILITGGEAGILIPTEIEAQRLAEFFIMAGVCEKDILIEDQARNTYENAVYSQRIIKMHPEFEKILLVTSAFHMKRSQMCFSRQGIEFDIFPVDYFGHESNIAELIPKPNLQGFQNWSIVIHEWLGILAYRLTNKC